MVTAVCHGVLLAAQIRNVYMGLFWGRALVKALSPDTTH